MTTEIYEPLDELLKNLYWYKAFVITVIDGDTIRVDIDMGLDHWIHNQKIRLALIDAPELRGEEREKGLLSKDYLSELILHKSILLHTKTNKRDNFGRILGELYITDDLSVNTILLAQGYAVPYVRK